MLGAKSSGRIAEDKGGWFAVDGIKLDSCPWRDYVAERVVIWGPNWKELQVIDYRRPCAPPRHTHTKSPFIQHQSFIDTISSIWYFSHNIIAQVLRNSNYTNEKRFYNFVYVYIIIIIVIHYIIFWVKWWCECIFSIPAFICSFHIGIDILDLKGSKRLPAPPTLVAQKEAKVSFCFPGSSSQMLELEQGKLQAEVTDSAVQPFTTCRATPVRTEDGAQAAIGPWSRNI